MYFSFVKKTAAITGTKPYTSKLVEKIYHDYTSYNLLIIQRPRLSGYPIGQINNIIAYLVQLLKIYYFTYPEHFIAQGPYNQGCTILAF